MFIKDNAAMISKHSKKLENVLENSCLSEVHKPNRHIIYNILNSSKHQKYQLQLLNGIKIERHVVKECVLTTPRKLYYIGLEINQYTINSINYNGIYYSYIHYSTTITYHLG